MKNLSFFSVLRNNLQCAFCRNKTCRLRYYPEKKRLYMCGGTRYAEWCPKEKEKRFNKVLRRKLP